jgi:hypothetical protein
MLLPPTNEEQEVPPMQSPQLTIKQTPTGYWTVKRGSVELASAMTRSAAERERELLRRLNASTKRRAGRRTAVKV